MAVLAVFSRKTLNGYNSRTVAPTRFRIARENLFYWNGAYKSIGDEKFANLRGFSRFFAVSAGPRGFFRVFRVFSKKFFI